MKFTPEGGSIAIRMKYPAAGRVSIEVQDNGIGIEEGQLESIFERFYKSDASRNRSIQGNGWG
ncbi:hypothetical protein PCURB6_04250 [Paenibacillus curdlanolyticus]|nr:hypothetical protein PCURB6_04250 [Paenibacillus curdlanolyticus]